MSRCGRCKLYDNGCEGNMCIEACVHTLQDYICDILARAEAAEARAEKAERERDAAKRLADAGVLVNCPFCGGEAMVEYDTIEPFEYTVFCGDCGVMPTTSEDEQVARLAWNTRAPILSSEEIERLEGQT